MSKKPGRYQLRHTFGGQGEPQTVHRANDTEIGRVAFIKLLRPVDSGSQAGKEEFERGVKQLQVLDHPNIASVHDYGHFHGMAYLATDEPATSTLGDYIDERGALELPAFVAIFADILDGLAAAHRHGIIHGDLGQSEILLVSEEDSIDRAALFGFSFPRLHDSSGASGDRKTAQASAVGAVAPERVVGREFDERIDLYSLGLVAYAALTTRRPFSGAGRGVVFQHIHQSPPPLEDELGDNSSIPDELAEFVHQLMRKDPNERPESAEEARSLLKSAVGPEKFETYIDRDVEALEGEPASESSGSNRRISQDIRAALPSDVQEALDASEQSGEGQASEAGADSLPSAWKWLLIAGGFVCALAGVAVATIVLEAGEEARPAGERIDVDQLRRELAASTRKDRRRRLNEILDRSRSAIENRNLQTARVLLELVGTRIDQYPEMKDRVQTLRKRLEVFETLETARKLEKKNEIGDAIKKYHEVLSVMPEHERATKRLEKLKSSAALKLESNIKGTVYLDGLPVGRTPFSKLIPADAMRIEVRRPGYRTWSKQITPEGGTKLQLSAELRPGVGGGGGGGGASTPKKKSSEGSSGDQPLMEMKID